MDTYSPKELEKLLSSLKLKGLKVMKIESSSNVFNSIKKERSYEGEKDYIPFYKDAEVDWDIILTFDNGKKVGFFFASSSHEKIINYTKNYELKDVDYQKNELNVAEMFPEIIGKTISDYKVFSVDSLEELGVATGRMPDLKIIKTSTLLNLDSSSMITVTLDLNAISISCCFITCVVLMKWMLKKSALCVIL